MRQYNGVSWLSEQQLTTGSANGLTPALAQLSNGTVMLVWASDKTGTYSLFYKSYTGGAWTGGSQLTFPQGRDSTPSLLQLRNGTLLLFWTRESLVNGSVVRYIWAKSYNNGTWSPEARFSSGGSEKEPSLFQSDDGTIWVAYAANRFGNLDIFYKTYNGAWSSEIRLESNTADDYDPWIMQDLNGTMWAFWTRCVPITSTSCENDVFYKTSTNLGAAWSAEVQFTVDPTGYVIDDNHPSAIHYNRDKLIYVFWGSDLPTAADFDVWLRTSSPVPFHQSSVSNATAGPSTLLQGGVVKLNGTANNPGSYNETVFVNGYYQNATGVLFKTVTVSLKPGSSAFVQMSWNTTKAVPAKYKVVLVVLPVPGESPRLLANNTAVAGSTNVRCVAPDIDCDGRVDIIDVARVAAKFGWKIITPNISGDCSVGVLDVSFVAFYFGTKVGDPNWNPRADLDNSGKVDIYDVALIASEFGQKMGPEDLTHDCVVDILDVAYVASWFGFGT
jgi:hypothetical protein